MKAIQPLSIWANGEIKEANKMNLHVVHDDLKSSCTFYYSLLKETEYVQPENLNQNPEELSPAADLVPTYSSEILTQGNLIISGEDYDNWNNETNINDAAYVWAAGKLGLTLI
jgi:hypothetical protein